jgi:hypothetical protein
MSDEAFNTHDWEKEPGPVPDFNYPDWTCKRCGARWNKLFGDYGTGASNYCQEPGSEDMKEPWKDGSPVEGERRWLMQGIDEFMEDDLLSPCRGCKHKTEYIGDKAGRCASCTVRPSRGSDDPRILPAHVRWRLRTRG